MSVIGAVLLLAVYWDFGRLHIQYDALRRIEGFRPPMSSRLMRVKPAKFCSSASISVSNVCKREVSAAPRSQVFSEPISRNVGSCESRSASLTSSYPAMRLQTDWRNRSANGSCVFFSTPWVGQVVFDELAHSQVFVQLPKRNQTPIRSHP